MILGTPEVDPAHEEPRLSILKGPREPATRSYNNNTHSKQMHSSQSSSVPLEMINLHNNTERKWAERSCTFGLQQSWMPS